jgi:hypothetical protein
LELYYAELNGRYPFLFNSFPLLEKLNISSCRYLKWDLEMLSGLPLLKELDCFSNKCLTGNINSLRVLEDTLEKVNIQYCDNVEGNFMDLANFPHLRVLHLYRTAVTGDIRDIGDNDFSVLECLDLPRGVYGGRGCEFQRISDGPDVARAVYLLIKQRPGLKIDKDWCVNLSEDSPDCYASVDVTDTGAPPFYIPFMQDTPPFFIHLVQAGPRVGYRWASKNSIPCEVNWLDPEPDRDSSDYEEYIAKIQKIERGATLFMYRGFQHPPSEEEYNRLFEEEVQRDRAQGIPQVSFA